MRMIFLLYTFKDAKFLEGKKITIIGSGVSESPDQ